MLICFFFIPVPNISTILRLKVLNSGGVLPLPRFSALLGVLCLIWFFRELSTMPNSNNPNSFSFYTVKETVRGYNNFTKRKIRKFRQYSAGLRKLSKPGQDLSRLVPESGRCCWVLAVNISNGCKKLAAPRRSEKNFQSFFSFNKESASVRTTSRSYPLPASISFSPRARMRKSSNSCWECS